MVWELKVFVNIVLEYTAKTKLWFYQTVSIALMTLYYLATIMHYVLCIM